MTTLQKEKEKEKEKRFSMYKTEPYKTDLRRDAIARRRELTKFHLLNREKTHDRRLIGRTVSRSLVTIDTHKARGNVDVLRMVIRDVGWREFPFQRRDHNCDVTWHAVGFADQAEIYSGKINKFPGALEIFHKVNLFRWLEFMKTLFPEEYSFFPRTWLLPHQYNEFACEVRALNEKKPKVKPMFIVKPSEGAQGDGIYLLRDPQQYSSSNGKCHVVQEYLSNVLVLEKFKFDLRIYVVLRSLDPLEFHICKEGLARFSTIPYEMPTNKNMHETFMHLTNYSLNKKSSDFKKSDKEDEGSKRKLTAVFKQMERMGHDVELIWQKIEEMVSKTLIAVVGELKVEHQAAIPPGKPGPTCFQVLGFDVLLLKNLEPILLEVNSNPSLSITEEHESPTGGVEYMISAKDEDVKRKLIRDTLILIAPKNKYTRKRRRRHRRRRHQTNEEEDMDVDNPNHSQGRHNRSRRERDISIKYMDVEDDRDDKQKSIFDESDYSNKKFVRNETCRVFIEGEGEVFFSDHGPSNPKYFPDYREPPKQETSPEGNGGSKKSGNKQSEGQSMDTSDRLPSVFLKPGDKPGDMMLEGDEDNEVSRSRPMPFDLSLLDSSEDEEEEEESSLKEIFPTLYGDKYRGQRIVERLADIFITCLGVKGCLRLGPTMFRLFARKCHLNRKGITNAAIDILYIDMQRKWEYMNPDRTSGLNFFAFVSGCCKIASSSFYGANQTAQLDNFIEHCQNFLKIPTELEMEAMERARKRSSRRYLDDDGTVRLPTAGRKSGSRSRSSDEWPAILEGLCFLGFVSACYEIARRKFYESNRHDMLQALVDYCEENIKLQTMQNTLPPPRPFGRRESHRSSLTLFPRRTITSLEEESMKKIFEKPLRRQGSLVRDVTSMMRVRQERMYLPRTLTHTAVVGDE